MAKVSDIKQEDIIKSAIEVFSQKGFEQASMEGISKQAGVSKRTLYKYYPNKDALFEVIVDKLICRFDDHAASQFEASVAIEQQLAELTLKQLCYLNSPDFQVIARMVMVECIRCPKASSVLMSKFDGIEDCYGLHQWVQAGIEANCLAVEDITMAVNQYVGGIKALVFWPQLLGHQAPPSNEDVAKVVTQAAKGFIATYQVSR